MSIQLNKLQKLIDGDWIHTATARNACMNNTFKEFLLQIMPKPLFLNIIAYLNYNKCLDKCMDMLSGPTEVELKLFPIWYCHNPDDTPANPWEKAYAIKIGNQPIAISEISSSDIKKIGLDFNTVVTTKVKIWNAGTIGESRNYAPSVPLPMRGLIYCVVDLELILIEQIINEEILETIPEPSEKIPPFSEKVLPALINYPNDILEQIKSFEHTSY